ncbi:MAG: transcription antitermination factor NusB [Pseudomonadota bacterium]
MSEHSTSTKSDKKRMRSAARLFATQALFQMEASSLSVDEVREEFETHRLGMELDGDTYSEANIDLFRALLNEAVNRQARIDQLTDAALKDTWPIARIDPTLRALFRAAGAELVTQDTPPKVAISEYVDVAKAFFPEGKESKFVNAVLDHMARATRPEAF